MGDAFKLEVGRDLGLKVSISTERFDKEAQQLKAAGKAVVETEAGALALDEWKRVLVTYDRALLNIYVEGLLLASLPEEGAVARTKSKLVVGGGQQPWTGSIDNLVVSAVGAQEEVQLPEGVWFAPGTPKEVVFAGDGGLDRSVVREPIVFELEYADGRRETVRVNMYGTVE